MGATLGFSNAMKKQLFVLAAAVTICAPLAAIAGTITQTIAASNLRNEAPTSAIDKALDADSQNTTACEVLIAVQVPHNRQAIDKLTAYPFPVRPPVNAKPAGPLYDDMKNLKSMCLNLGYTQRRHYAPYPAFGWRFENAYKAAKQKSGLGHPHSMFEAYGWAKEMAKYVKVEVDRINEEEEQRLDRYTKACEHWETEGVDIESEATRRGLVPVPIKTVKSLDKIKLEPGTWWITGTRKVPGLLYYWQQPVTVVAGTTPTVKLEQGNALFIQGAW
jgi:hypothetical protein